MDTVGFAAAAGLVAFALASRRLEDTPVTPPMAFTVPNRGLKRPGPHVAGDHGENGIDSPDPDYR